MSVDRRAALALAGWGILESRFARGQQAPAFFTAREREVLDLVSETILPADSHSPGAHAAGVGQYVDLVAANSPENAQRQWRSRLAAFTGFCEKTQGKPFQDLAQAGRKAVIEALARKEAHPETDAERFFADMKAVTVFAYYTSRTGLLDELEYKGNQAMSGFPACGRPIKGQA